MHEGLAWDLGRFSLSFVFNKPPSQIGNELHMRLRTQVSATLDGVYHLLLSGASKGSLPVDVNLSV